MQNLRTWLFSALALVAIIFAGVIVLRNIEGNKKVFVLDKNEKVFLNSGDSTTGVYSDDLGSKMLDNQKVEITAKYDYWKNKDDNETKKEMAKSLNSYKPWMVKKYFKTGDLSPNFPPAPPTNIDIRIETQTPQTQPQVQVIEKEVVLQNPPPSVQEVKKEVSDKKVIEYLNPEPSDVHK